MQFFLDLHVKISLLEFPALVSANIKRENLRVTNIALRTFLDKGP